jgi:hypothetical protein
MSDYDAKAKEPIGAEATIYHHMLMLDYWDYQATLADGMDCGDAAKKYDAKAKLHKIRLAELEAMFPATYQTTRHAYNPTAKEIHAEAGQEYKGDDDAS